jgi:hypothetical protein
MPNKKWWTSKTLWFNVVDALLAAADKLSGANILPNEAHTVINVVGNIILRFLTVKPIG